MLSRVARGPIGSTGAALPRRPLPHGLRQPHRIRHHHPAAAVLRADVRRVADDHRPAVRVVLGGAVHRGPCPGRAVRSLGPPAHPDLQPARDGRQLRAAGDGAQHHDALHRADRRRPVGREHHDGAGLHRRRHAGRGPREALRPHRRGVRSRVHLRPRARRGVRAHQLHGADLGGRRRLGHRRAARVPLAAGAGATRLGGRGAALVARARRPDVAAGRSARSWSSISATGSRSRSTRRRSRCSASVASGGTRRTSATSWPRSRHLA